ncbi:MAG: hypothetical protein ACYC9T_08405 [Trichloromonadaceae bacterium]
MCWLVKLLRFLSLIACSFFAAGTTLNYCPKYGVHYMVLESGIADLLERLLLRIDPRELGVTSEALEQVVCEYCNHQKKLQEFSGPVLILHARRDSLVEVSHGERLYQWSAGMKRLVIFPRGDHNDVMYVNAREYFDALRDFLGSLDPL